MNNSGGHGHGHGGSSIINLDFLESEFAEEKDGERIEEMIQKADAAD